MTRERYEFIAENEDAKLTEQEIREGFHFCLEFDGMLTAGESPDGIKRCFCDWNDSDIEESLKFMRKHDMLDNPQ